MTISFLIKYLENIKKSKIYGICSFTILTAVAAQFTIPVRPVPFTLQSVFVVLSGSILGAQNGAISQILYLGLGIIGLPVFAQIPGGLIGIDHLFGPTGGYLLCFPLAALTAGILIKFRQNYLFVVFSMFISNLIIIMGGAIYLDLFFIHDFYETLKVGVLIFSVWSLAKIFLTSIIYLFIY